MRTLLLAVLVFSGGGIAHGEGWFLKDRPFYFIAIEANDPKMDDPNLEIAAGYWFYTITPAKGDPVAGVRAGLCTNVFQLEVDPKLPPLYSSFKFSGKEYSGYLSISKVGTIRPHKDWPGWYEVIHGNLIIKFTDLEIKNLWGKLLMERRKKYCPPAMS